MSRLSLLLPYVRRLASPVSDTAQADGEGGRTQFAIFAGLFAMAVLLDRASLGDWEVVSHDTVVSLAAIFLLLRPTSVPRFVALLIAQLIHAAIGSPVMTNHWTLIAFSSLAILINLAVAMVRREGWLADPGAVYRRVAPVLRIQVLLLYSIAAFAKLNGDFFDPALSCGAALAQDLFSTGPLRLAASWQDWPAIVGTVALEASLPLLLLIRRTRLIAVFAGGTFHVILAVAGHVSFSGFAIAFYALFLPDDLPDRLRALRASNGRLRAWTDRVAAFAAQRAALPLLGGMWILASFAVSYGPDRVLSAIHVATAALFLVYVATLTIVLLRALAGDAAPAYRRRPFRLAHPGWALAPLFAVILGVSPYLGLRTQNTFTMYSNVQTEDGQWNHALLPQAVQIFSLQDDPVRMVTSSDPLLARHARSGTRLVWWDFRRYASDRPDASVVYEYRGRRRAVARVGDDAILSRSPNALAEKVLIFRNIPPREANTCRILRDYEPRNGS